MTIDTADRLLERGYGTDLDRRHPEWSEQYQVVATARSLMEGS